MATVYRSNDHSGNWSSDDGTWVTSDGGSTHANHPVAGDTVYLTSNSGNLTIDTTSACAIIDCTGYTGTLTQSAQMTTSGNVTLVSEMTFSYTGTPTWIMSGGTFIPAGKTLYTLNPTGTVTLSTSNLNLAGGLSLTSSGILSGTGRTLTFTGTGTWSQTNNSTTNLVQCNVTFNTAGTITIGSHIWFYNNSPTLTYTAGTIDTSTNNSTLHIANCTLNTNGMSWKNVQLEGFSKTFTLSSNLDINGNLIFNDSGTSTFSGAYNVTVAGNLTTTSSAIGGTAWAIKMDGTGTWSNSSTGIIKCNLTFAGDVTISGNVYYSTGTLTYSSGTITTTSSTLNIGNANTTLTTNGMTWNNISCTAMNAKTLTLGSALQVSGNLDLTGTTTHTILACGTNNVTLGGNWTNPKGTTGRTGNNTFIFTSGTHAIDGNTDFYNMTINAGATLTFDDADTFTVTNNFNANGTSASHIIMKTDNPGNTVDFDVTGTVQTVTYVDATDIDSAGGDAITTTGGSINNTVNWSLISLLTNNSIFFGCAF